MKQSDLISRIKTFPREHLAVDSERVIMLSPGLLLVALGIAVFLFPRLILFLLASFFLLLGGLLSFAAWKFMQFKRRILKVARELDAKVIIQGVHVPRPAKETTVDEVDVKKIILH